MRLKSLRKIYIEEFRELEELWKVVVVEPPCRRTQTLMLNDKMRDFIRKWDIIRETMEEFIIEVDDFCNMFAAEINIGL